MGPLRRPPYLAGLAVLLLLITGCEEKLPDYEMPDLPLLARIEIQNIDLGQLLGDPEPFYVYVENVDAGIDQYFLSPPYEISASVNVSLAREPNRSILLEENVAFSVPSDTLHLGGNARVFLPFPLTDSNGLPWNWQRTSQMRHELLFQGKVIVKQNGERIAELNTPRESIILTYEPVQRAP